MKTTFILGQRMTSDPGNKKKKKKKFLVHCLLKMVVGGVKTHTL